jgi:hypothetical protein
MAEDRGHQRDERDQLAVQYGVIGIAAVVAAMRYQGTGAVHPHDVDRPPATAQAYQSL